MTETKKKIDLPFKVVKSEVSGGFIDYVHTTYKDGLDIANYHEDKYGDFDTAILQSPFTSRWVGGKAHRHVDLNTGSVSLEERPEAWHLEFDSNGVKFYSHKYKNSPPAYWTRDGLAKRPVNILNIKTTDLYIGNFSRNYEVVQSSGRRITNNLIVDGYEAEKPLTTTFIKGASEYLLPELPPSNQSKTVIVERFNAPGSKEESSRGNLDREGEEMSPNIPLSFRNIKIRTPFYSQLSTRTPQGGVSVHGVNRNRLIRAGNEQVDNGYVVHAIPRTDIQYSWVTASSLTTAAELGGYQSYGDSAGEVFTDISFISGSYVISGSTPDYLVDNLFINSLVKDRKAVNLATKTFSITHMDTSASYSELVGTPYTFTSWTSIRNKDGYVAKQLRKENIISIQNEPAEKTIISKISGKKLSLKSRRGDASTNYIDPPVTFKYLPTVHSLLFTGNSIDHSLTHTYTNNISSFANKELLQRLSRTENKKQFYHILSDYYINPEKYEEQNPVSELKFFTYSEFVWPKEQNTGLEETRKRPKYYVDKPGFSRDGKDIQLGKQRAFWRDEQLDRRRSANSAGGYYSSIGYLSTEEVGNVSFLQTEAGVYVDNKITTISSSYQKQIGLDGGIFNSVALLGGLANEKEIFEHSACVQADYYKQEKAVNEIVHDIVKRGHVLESAGEFNSMFIDFYEQVKKPSIEHKTSLGTLYRNTSYKSLLTSLPQERSDSDYLIPKIEEEEVFVNPKLRYLPFLGGGELNTSEFFQNWTNFSNQYDNLVGYFSDSVESIYENSEYVYFGGSFDVVENLNVNRIVKFHKATKTFSIMGDGVNGTVRAIEEFDGEIYIGGDFTKINWNDATGDDAYYIAKWSSGLNKWVTLVGGSVNGAVRSLKVYENNLYVGGDFTKVAWEEEDGEDSFGVGKYTLVPIYWEETQEISSSSPTSTDYFGGVIAVTPDSTRLVSARGYGEISGQTPTNVGIINVFDYNNSAKRWELQAILTTSVGQTGDQFGFFTNSTIDIANDGNSFIIGNYSGGPGSEGRAVLFRSGSEGWYEEQIFTASNPTTTLYYGYKASMNEDCTKIIISSHFETVGPTTGAGVAYIYRSSSLNGWEEEEKIVSPSPGTNFYFGRSNAISSDGAKIIIAEMGSSGGKLHYYESSSLNGWVYEQSFQGDDTISGDVFGIDVSTNDDLTYLVVGARDADPEGLSAAGAAYIFKYDGSWVQEAKIYATQPVAGDQFGTFTRIAKSPGQNPNTVLIGSPFAGAVDTGLAYLFTSGSNGWQEERTFTPPIISGIQWSYSYYGAGIALSGDGLTSYIGSPGRHLPANINNGAGIIYVFQKKTSWNTTDIPVGVSGSVYVLTFSGSDLYAGGDFEKINWNGTTGDDIYRFAKWDGLTWSGIQDGFNDIVRTIEFYDSDIYVGGDFTRVAWNGSQGRKISYISRFRNDWRILTSSLGFWGNEAYVTSSIPEINARFAEKIDVSADGTRIIVGAYRSDDTFSDQGSAFIFNSSSDGGWIQEVELKAFDPSPIEYFGYSVAVSSNGAVAAIGSYRDEKGAIQNVGSAYIFRSGSSGWIEEEILYPSDGAQNDYFGYSITTNEGGDVVVVGAHLRDNPSAPIPFNAGAAYVFRSSSAGWIEEQILTASNSNLYNVDKYGSSIAISKDSSVIVVGAQEKQLSNLGGSAALSSSGAVYVYRSGSQGWYEEAFLTASDREELDQFGVSIGTSYNGNAIVVGAYLEGDGIGEQFGAVYIFRSGSQVPGGSDSWFEEFKIREPVTSSLAKFGYSVDMSDDSNTIVIGSPESDNTGLVDAGNSYIYRYLGELWELDTILSASNPRRQALYGNSVKITRQQEGRKIFVASTRRDNIQDISSSLGDAIGAFYSYDFFDAQRGFGVDNRVRRLIASGSSLYVGGDFEKTTWYNVGSLTIPVDGDENKYFVKWEVNNDVATGSWSGLGTFIKDNVKAIVESDNRFYIGGDSKTIIWDIPEQRYYQFDNNFAEDNYTDFRRDYFSQSFGISDFSFSTLDQGMINFFAENNKAFFDSYEDFVEDIRVTVNDYSVIPEFRISSHMEYYVKQAGGNFRTKNNAFLELDGAGENYRSGVSEIGSLNGTFYKTYATSDIMKKHDEMKKENSNVSKLSEVSITVSGIKKLLPYNGFYPKQRTVQLANLYAEYIEDSLHGGVYNLTYFNDYKSELVSQQDQYSKISSIDSIRYGDKYYLVANLQNDINGPINDIQTIGGDIYFVGSFTKAGNTQSFNITKYDGVRFENLSGGTNGEIKSIRLLEGVIYIAGSFSKVNWNGTTGTDANNIARWNGTSWEAIEGVGTNGSINTMLVVLAEPYDQLYIGGSFTEINTDFTTPSASYGLAKYDLATASVGLQVLAGVSGAVNVLENVLGSPNNVPVGIYVGGAFTKINWDGNTGASANNLARLDINTQQLNSISNQPNGEVFALFNKNDSAKPQISYLYVGGNFTQVGTQTSRYFGYLSGSGIVAVPNAFNAPVKTFGQFGADIYIGGDFTKIGWNGTSGTESNKICKLATSNTFSQLSTTSNIGLNNTVNKITAIGNDLYVGGNFTKTIQDKYETRYYAIFDQIGKDFYTENTEICLYSASYSEDPQFVKVENSNIQDISYGFKTRIVSSSHGIFAFSARNRKGLSKDGYIYLSSTTDGEVWQDLGQIPGIVGQDASSQFAHYFDVLLDNSSSEEKIILALGSPKYSGSVGENAGQVIALAASYNQDASNWQWSSPFSVYVGAAENNKAGTGISLLSCSTGYHIYFAELNGDDPLPINEDYGNILFAGSSNGTTWSTPKNIASGSISAGQIGFNNIKAVEFKERIYVFFSEPYYAGGLVSVISSSIGNSWGSGDVYSQKSTLYFGKTDTRGTVNSSSYENALNTSFSSCNIEAFAGDDGKLYYAFANSYDNVSERSELVIGNTLDGLTWQRKIVLEDNVIEDNILKIRKETGNGFTAITSAPYDIDGKNIPIFFSNYSTDNLAYGIYAAKNNVYSKFSLKIEESEKYYKHAALEPFFAPGILYNTIKSGIAVDWPCATGSNTSIVPDGTNNVVNVYYPKTFEMARYEGPKATVNMYGHLKSNINYRIPFENILFPNEAFTSKDFQEEDIRSRTVLDSLDAADPLVLFFDKTYVYGGYEPYISDFDFGELNENGPKRFSIPFVYRRNNIKDTGLYTLAMNNFLAETVKFFLKDEKMTAFVSEPDYKWKEFDSDKTYYMDIVLEKSPGLVMTEAYHSDKHPIGSNGEKMNGRYFGYPVNKTEKNLWGAEDFTDEEKRLIHNDPAYAPYTPPYFEGEARARISFKPRSDRSFGLQEILENATIENIFIDVARGAATGSDAYINKMPIASSIDLFGSAQAVEVEIDERTGEQTVRELPYSQNWIISPRMETPVLDFSSNNLTQYSGSTYTTTSGYGRGMWSYHGNVPKNGESLKMRLEYPFSTVESELTASLLEQVGLKAEEKNIGVIADTKTVSEAVILIPYLEKQDKTYTVLNKTGFNFIKINKKLFNEQKRNQERGDSAILANSRRDVEFDIKTTTITRMIEKMKNYIIPPELNFLLYPDIYPFVMYIFEFEHTFDQEDLENIWQGSMPKISRIAEKQDLSIKHPSSPYEFFEGKEIPDNLRWLVFKVKKKAEYSYFNVTSATKDDSRFDFNKVIGREKGTDLYSYNWPYDYFSLVEFAKIKLDLKYTP